MIPVSVLRTASLVGIPVHIRFDHKIQESAHSPPRRLTNDERVHDSSPHHEKVIFDVHVDWIGAQVIMFADRIESVFNYSAIFHLVTTYFHEQESLKAPLESVLDLIVSKAAVDPRVVAVRSSASRPNILLNGTVRVSVAWSRPRQETTALPALE